MPDKPKQPQIRKAKIGELIPDDRNANQGTERGNWALTQSIERQGLGRSILLDKDGRIIAGNKTHGKAGELGLDDVLIVPTDGKTLVAVQRTDISLDSPEGRELAIADNRAGELNLNWDFGELMEMHDEGGINLNDWWTGEELDGMMPEELPTEDPEDAQAVADAGASDDYVPRVQEGEIWKLGRHYIACADCTDEASIRLLMDKAGVNAVDMCWSDPPYGIDLLRDGASLGNSKAGTYSEVIGDRTTDVAYKAFDVYRRFCPGAPNGWWGANHYGGAVEDSSCWLVWDKDHHGMTFADAELCWTNMGGPVRVFRHAWSGNHRDSEHGQRRVHPTQKPVALARWFYESYGKSGDVIIDPFLGSGMSLIAAEEMQDRTVIGFELSNHYCSIICDRWEKLTGQTAEKVGNI